jgi:di/tricarboxylate transporter
MLHFDSIVVILVILFIIVSLYTQIAGPAFTFIIAVLVLGLFGILNPSEILAGFANEQIMVIIMLLLIGEIIRKTGVLEGLFDRIFRNTKSHKGFMGMMVGVVSAFSAIHLITLFMALAILLTLILLLRIASPKELPKSIDYNLAIIIAMSIAIGTAMIKTGVATHIADFLVHFFMPMGTLGLMAGIYIITTVVGAYITNKAAVAMIFPITISMAATMSINPLPLVLTMTYAATASFLTPVGYQTNLMVYGPGGYTFKDFLRIGAPLTLIYMIVSILILHYVFL